MSDVDQSTLNRSTSVARATLIGLGVVLGTIYLATAEQTIILGLAALAAITAISMYFPTVAVTGFIVIVVTNAAAIATDLHGAPPIGGIIVLCLVILLLLRSALGLEDLTASVYLLVPIGLYLTINALGLLWVDRLLPTVNFVSGLSKNLAIVVILCGFVTTRARFRAVVMAVGFSAAGLAALSTFQYATGTFSSAYFGFSTARVRNIAGATYNWRLEGPLGDPNFFAQLLVMSLPVVAALAFAARHLIFRIGALFGVPLIVVGIFLTFSRGGLVGFFVVAVVTALLARHRLPITMAFIATTVVSVLVVPTILFDRIILIIGAAEAMVTGSQAIADPALAQRLMASRAGIAIFEDSPFFGIGAGQFVYSYDSYALALGMDLGAPAQAHNRYIELAAEQGLVGMVAFFSVITAVLVAGAAAIRRFRSSGHEGEATLTYGLLLGIVGYLVTAIFLHDDYSRVFWLFVSLLVCAYAISSPRIVVENQ